MSNFHDEYIYNKEENVKNNKINLNKVVIITEN